MARFGGADRGAQGGRSSGGVGLYVGVTGAVTGDARHALRRLGQTTLCVRGFALLEARYECIMIRSKKGRPETTGVIPPVCAQIGCVRDRVYVYHDME